MKFHISTLTAALLMVFGMPVPSAWADDTPAAAHVPFRLLFNAYDGDPKKDTPEKFEFQINTIDLRQPSQFLKIGNTIVQTKWKLTKFEYKTRMNPIIQELEDVSELTLTNTETSVVIVLILNHVTDTAAPKTVK